MNVKLRTKVGAKQGASQTSGVAMAHPGLPLESPLVICIWCVYDVTI